MFKKYIKKLCKCIILQGTDLMNLSAAVSHFLNCLLSSAQIIHPQQNLEEVRRRTFIIYAQLLYYNDITIKRIEILLISNNNNKEQ